MNYVQILIIMKILLEKIVYLVHFGVIIFGVAMSSSVHVDNKEKYSLILNINRRKKLFN